MKMSHQEYARHVDDRSPKSPLFKNALYAFLIGGLICAGGQGLTALYETLGLEKNLVKAAVPMTLIFLGVLLTALGVYDKLARRAGAGTLVPITGFANAVASPAMEFRSEGLILGLSARMFVVAGPVIVFGVAASVIYGLILCLLQLFGFKTG
jgi:stage V sporulation protein AC